MDGAPVVGMVRQVCRITAAHTIFEQCDAVDTVRTDSDGRFTMEVRPTSAARAGTKGTVLLQPGGARPHPLTLRSVARSGEADTAALVGRREAASGSRIAGGLVGATAPIG